METFLLSDVGEIIFRLLDNQSLKNCSEVCSSWKGFLEKQAFFWKRFTDGHPGWNELFENVSCETFSILGKNFFTMAN